MILPILVGIVARAAVGYAIKAGVQFAARRAAQAAVRRILQNGLKKAEQRLAQEIKRRANCKSCKKLDDLVNPCQSLRKGGKGAFKGGSHSGVKGRSGAEANHTPASGAYPSGSIRYGQRPAMQMDIPDHKGTASWGSGGASYRAEQAKLIAQGKFLDAFAMDAATIMDSFPDGRYKEALEDAAAYAACLQKYGKV